MQAKLCHPSRWLFLGRGALTRLLEQLQQLRLSEGIAAAPHPLPDRLAALLEPDKTVLRALRLAGRLEPGIVEAHDVGVRPQMRPRLRLLRRRVCNQPSGLVISVYSTSSKAGAESNSTSSSCKHGGVTAAEQHSLSHQTKLGRRLWNNSLSFCARLAPGSPFQLLRYRHGGALDHILLAQQAVLHPYHSSKAAARQHRHLQKLNPGETHPACHSGSIIALLLRHRQAAYRI